MLLCVVHGESITLKHRVSVVSIVTGIIVFFARSLLIICCAHQRLVHMIIVVYAAYYACTWLHSLTGLRHGRHCVYYSHGMYIASTSYTDTQTGPCVAHLHHPLPARLDSAYSGYSRVMTFNRLIYGLLSWVYMYY